MTDRKIPISIYIHIPFCYRKCNYCDFLSSPALEDEKSVYIAKLLEEIDATQDADNYIVKSIFFGGGTPSIIKTSYICSIIEKVKAKYEFIANPEITIECNPGTIDENKISDYAKMGINRISIGAQSFDDSELKMLGRIHSASDIVKAVDMTKKSGIDNISLDLISSLPSQSVSSFEKTLKKAISLCCTHYSVYSLIVEPHTHLYENRDKYSFPDEDAVLEMDKMAKAILEENGFLQYEISNYSKPGKQCKHNITYWKRGAYRGYGLGASSLLFEQGKEIRFSAERNMKDYLADAANSLSERKMSEEYQVLSKEDIISEYMFLGLRMNEGICIDEYRQYFEKQIEKHTSLGLCEIYKKDGKNFYRMSEKGANLANLIMADYLL